MNTTDNMSTPTTTPRMVKCRDCDKMIEFVPIPGFPNIKISVCDPCIERARQARIDNVRSNRLEDFKRICPVTYQSSDHNHPSMPVRAKLEKILSWKPCGKGLILVGGSRCCKTRTMWMLLKKLFVFDNIDVAYTNASDLAERCRNQDDREELRNTPILFIDDLGKEKMTEHEENELYRLVEHRTARNKPIMFTTNFNGIELTKRLSPDRSGPIIDRIREFCTCIPMGRSEDTNSHKH